MGEYPIHTEEQPKNDNVKGSLYSFLIVGLLAIGSVCVIVANDPFTKARAAEKEAERARVQEVETEATTGVSPTMNPDELSEFVEEVQNLIENDWLIKEIDTEGIITIQGENVSMKCGVLDPTPQDQSDNRFRQYSDTQQLSARLGVVLPNKTALIWDRNMGMLSEGLGDASDVDTNSFVWACPLVQAQTP
jgi:hypothetical protein